MADVLPSVEAPELDLDPLKEDIRREVAALRSSGRRLFPEETDALRAPVTGRPAFDARQVRSMIALTNSFADLGVHVPPMHRFRGVVRRLARLTARLILTLSRFMTDRQRNFNHLTTRSLSHLADGLERSTASLAEQVHDLKELCKRQEKRIAALEDALNNRSEPSDSNHSARGPARPEA